MDVVLLCCSKYDSMLIHEIGYWQIYPLDALEETADFLSSCASFFKNAHGAKIKHAYAKMFIQLLLPVAAVGIGRQNGSGSNIRFFFFFT